MKPRRGRTLTGRWQDGPCLHWLPADTTAQKQKEIVQPHRSFVLRCLPVRGVTEGELAWRFSIQEAEPEAQRRAFNSLEDVVAFLRAELEPDEAEPVNDRES